jgi:Na+-transporting NADH:ubiquinone oxidoreductase subunit C
MAGAAGGTPDREGRVMSQRDSVANTIRVSLVVCLVCALVVSTAAVLLAPHQAANREQFRQFNIVRVAGLDEPGRDLASAIRLVEQRHVDLRTGEYVEVPPEFDPLVAARDPEQGRLLRDDPAGIRQIAHVGEVFLVRNEAGRFERLVLPVRGYGLWSTMHGFLALERDLDTIAGIGFHEHAETPGLGGEIDNPRWQAGWVGKQLFDDDGELALRVFKGPVPDGAPNPQHNIDGLSGATLTARGVQNLVRFWVGEQGYGPYLARLRERLDAGEDV